VNKNFRVLENALNRISVIDLRSYLERTGWKNISPGQKKWSIYKSNSNESMELVVPTSDIFYDSREKIRQIILALALIERFSPIDICSKIIGINYDSLLIKLQIDPISGTIPVEAAPKHIGAIKNLIIFAACSEINRKPYYDEPISGAVKLISSFKFCHTFEGSFGFEIASEITNYSDTNTMIAPVQRKIVERIAKGLILLQSAVDTEDPMSLIGSYDSALNSKMCDALSDIGLSGEVPFKFDIQWASSIEPDENLKIFNEITISEAHVSVLKYVSEQLKIVKPYGTQISGYVVNLHCINDPKDNQSRRTIELKVNHAEHGKILIKMDLAAKWYLLAIDAHTKGVAISAKGILQRKGSTWMMDAITDMVEV
jgi:hypothetical protein